MRHQGRSYALQALYQAELLESKAMKHVDRFLEQLDTSPEVKLYARELVEGTLLHRKHIDRYLRRNLEHWKLTRLSATVRNILRLAAYELITIRNSHTALSSMRLWNSVRILLMTVHTR